MLEPNTETRFEEIIRDHAPRMLGVARRLLEDEADAQDALQQAFLSAFQSLPGFSGGAELATWVHRIVVNAALMKLRSRRRSPAVSTEALLPSFDETGHHVTPVEPFPAEAELLGAERRWRVRECVERLPEPYRVVLVLRDLEELDTSETAAALGISEGAVKTRLHRARLAVAELLRQAFGAGGDR